MITFWIFSIAMVIIALVFLLRPFFRDMNKDEIERSALNVKITKERIAELEVELEQNTISQAEYEQTREELEQALLYDVEQEPDNATKVNNQPNSRFTYIAIIFTVPLLATSLYLYLGEPNLIEGSKKQTANAQGQGTQNGTAALPSMDELIDKLAARLKTNPDNAEGWFMLARSLMSMKRYEEAVVALEKTNKLIPNNPVVMLRYADALTMTNGGRISGKSFELIKKAVALKPDDPTGLWLAGMGYAEQGEYKKAISYWNILLALLKDDKSINEVQGLIRRAKKKAGISVAESVAPLINSADKKAITSLKVNVTIDSRQLKKVSMDDAVFVFAKAVNGPPMPLAVARRKVKDLPLQVTLDDTMAMIPSMSMKRYEEAVVALEKTNKLIPNNPVVMLRYADALTMTNGGRISGKSFELIKKAVALKPDDPTGLWLAGMGYAEQGEYKKAISYWNILLALLKDDKSINEVQGLIRRAKKKAGISVAESVAPLINSADKKAITSLKVNVTIDSRQLKKVSMDDAVFVFAKAVNGPPMPLAVARRKVKDLPLQVILDDTMAMIPSMKLSSFNKVKITARVSTTGKPLLQKGDIYSKEKIITLPYSGVINIKIDSIAD